MDIATYRLNWPREGFSEKEQMSSFPFLKLSPILLTREKERDIISYKNLSLKTRPGPKIKHICY